jgi:hypothetical protein
VERMEHGRGATARAGEYSRPSGSLVRLAVEHAAGGLRASLGSSRTRSRYDARMAEWTARRA